MNLPLTASISGGILSQMTEDARFIHVTDAHISLIGTVFQRDDQKVAIPKIGNDTREEMLELLFSRLAERMKSDGLQFDGALFSGDAQDRGLPGGHELLLQLLLRHFRSLGIREDRIVAIPGNHDVPRDSLPSSPARYADFLDAWARRGCIVPWLDGIDAGRPPLHPERHRLIADDLRWVIYPINTSNWSHVTSILPNPLAGIWDAIPEKMSGGNPDRENDLRLQLASLARYDMARVSKDQLEALRAIVASTPKPARGRQLRIAMMHHHLRSPTLREELKPFAEISNLEQVRAFLRGSEIDIVIHGHKHEHATYFESSSEGDIDNSHRTLVVSAATFEPGREHDAARIVSLSGLPYTPEIRIEPLPLPRPGAANPRSRPIVRRLWVQTNKSPAPIVVTPGVPIVVEGSDLDEVYARACAAASSEAAGTTLIVHLDLPDSGMKELPLPDRYPNPDRLIGEEQQSWLRDLVKWWQIEKSHLEDRIPYVHGVRLRRYGGKINQIERIITLLRDKASTRALAVLIDPSRDFTKDAKGEEFASFCLVEFRRRNRPNGKAFVDAIAFYRAQEFARWWPINVAELRLLQWEICEALALSMGRITTIAADARTISKSPTQVAMPAIDRWLDQSPERLYVLGDSILRSTIVGATQELAVAEWRRTLNEHRAGLAEYNPDGMPVAIEGLETLAAYLSVADVSASGDIALICQRLRSLAGANHTFERSKREHGDFTTWVTVTRPLVEELDHLTSTRWSGSNHPPANVGKS